MSPRGIATVVALLAAATLTACSGGDDTAPVAAAPSVAAADASAATPAPMPTEGSVTQPDGRFITYPDGFTARITKVEQVPSEWGVDVPAGLAVVRVTIDLDNAGTVPVPLVDPAPHMALCYGPNRDEADPEAGYSGNGPRYTLQNDLPRRVAPGRTVHYVRSFTVPTDSLDQLAVSVSPPGTYTEFTFTDAQTMLKRVR